MNELKVGLLALLALGSIVIVSLKITADKASFGDFVEYSTILGDASGVYENSSIKVAGIVAGRITKISLSGSQALINFEVLERIKITSNSRIRVKSVGFLGDKYIDIFLGDPSLPRLKADSLVSAEAGAGLEQIGKDASEILKDVKIIAAVIKESLYTDEKKNAIKEIISQVNQLTRNANEISGSIKRMITGNEANINNTIANLNRLAAQLAYETDRAQEGSLMQGMDNIGPILEKVDRSAADLASIMSDVKDGRGTVGKLLRDEEVVDRVNETLAGVNRIVGRVNSFKTNVMLYTGANNRDGAKTEVDLDLIPSPERFFRFGAVIGDGTTIEREVTRTTTINNGGENVENEKEVDENIIRFNLQIGRKFNQFTLRVGLIESTGGLGFDYSIPDYGFTNRLEVYDNRLDLGVNVRYTAELRLWSILHAKFMADELARSSEFHNYTFSAGLKFSDDDLAALIGLAL